MYSLVKQTLVLKCYRFHFKLKTWDVERDLDQIYSVLSFLFLQKPHGARDCLRKTIAGA